MNDRDEEMVAPLGGLEAEVARVNEADELIRRAAVVYLDVGWSAEEFAERVEEIADEVGLGSAPSVHVGGGPKRPKPGR